jgi:hypothetical protein
MGTDDGDGTTSSGACRYSAGVSGSATALMDICGVTGAEEVGLTSGESEEAAAVGSDDAAVVGDEEAAVVGSEEAAVVGSEEAAVVGSEEAAVVGSEEAAEEGLMVEVSVPEGGLTLGVNSACEKTEAADNGESVADVSVLEEDSTLGIADEGNVANGEDVCCRELAE